MQTHLTQIFRYNWTQIISQDIIANKLNTNLGYTHIQSRTLNDVLHNTFYDSYSYTKGYTVLPALCALITKNHLNFRTFYTKITSEEADTLVPENLINNIDNTAQHTTIYFCHVPKGITYIRNALDKNPNQTRIKQLEVLCIESPSHFIRIYKGFGNTRINDITIFSNVFTTKLIDMLVLMLPNVLDITPITHENADETLTKSEQDYNTKVNALRRIFEKLWEIYQYKSPTTNALYSTQELIDIANELKLLTDAYLSLFNFEEEKITSFMQHLMHAKNENLNKHLTQELNSINASIPNLEYDLEQKYKLKAKLERDIIANKQLTDTDVAPFMDTIKNTKAIEILYSDANKMKLRITAPLQYFTESDFEAHENNQSSIYNQSFRQSPELQKILHKIFITREYRILFQSIITLTIQNSYDTAPMYFSAQTHDMTNFTQFPNPHLWHHDCWSKAKTEMQKNLINDNYELVVMQMVAATQSMNVAETASFINGFLSDIRNNTEMYNLITLLDETGHAYSLNEAIALEKTQTQPTPHDTPIQSTTQRTQKYSQIEIPDDPEWIEEHIDRMLEDTEEVEEQNENN